MDPMDMLPDGLKLNHNEIVVEHSAKALAGIAASLNNRPRKTLEFQTPSQKHTELLAHTA